MTLSFDPYHRWLGIPKKDQPPHHYRLLGIDLFESDREVIDAAANRLMAYLQDMATGDHPDLSQELLNEVAGARRCLLNDAKRADYDTQLKTTLAAAAPPPLPVAKTPINGDVPATENVIPPIITDKKPKTPRRASRSASSSRPSPPISFDQIPPVAEGSSVGEPPSIKGVSSGENMPSVQAVPSLAEIATDRVGRRGDPTGKGTKQRSRQSIVMWCLVGMIALLVLAAIAVILIPRSTPPTLPEPPRDSRPRRRSSFNADHPPIRPTQPRSKPSTNVTAPSESADPAPPEIDPPEIDPPEIDPPEIDPPEIDPPETDPPKTDPPKTDPPKTGSSHPPDPEGSPASPPSDVSMSSPKQLVWAAVKPLPPIPMSMADGKKRSPLGVSSRSMPHGVTLELVGLDTILQKEVGTFRSIPFDSQDGSGLTVQFVGPEGTADADPIPVARLEIATDGFTFVWQGTAHDPRSLGSHSTWPAILNDLRNTIVEFSPRGALPSLSLRSEPKEVEPSLIGPKEEVRDVSLAHLPRHLELLRVRMRVSGGSCSSAVIALSLEDRNTSISIRHSGKRVADVDVCFTKSGTGLKLTTSEFELATRKQDPKVLSDAKLEFQMFIYLDDTHKIPLAHTHGWPPKPPK